VALLLAAACAAPAWAGTAHEHGVAKLDIAVEPGKVEIGLESPLDNLLGFERAPRTDAERRAAQALVARLRAGEALFRIDPAAQCRLANVSLRSAPLRLGSADAKAAADDHGDLDASYGFACKGGAPGRIDVGLFEAFPRMTRVEVQLVTPKGQSRRTLRRGATRLELGR
jgi:hypothetical protein